MALTQSPSSNLGPVLITGGNGFIAYHIIAKLLELDPHIVIHSIDINTSRNRHANKNVYYHNVDIATPTDVARIVELAQPVTIFHTASPDLADGAPDSEYYRVITKGAASLLDAAAKSKTVRAFVNTSSAGVINDNESDLIDGKEDLPLLHAPQQKRAYCIAKAEAEEAIQAANRSGGTDNKGLLTCSIRTCLVFGERDVAALGTMIAVAKQGKSRFQIGNGQNPYDFVYVGNLADAHILTAQTLLNAWGKLAPTNHADRLDGSCINLTNDEPWLFWDYQRAVAALVGKPVRPEDVVVIPLWMMLVIGFVSEWAVWLISGGTRRPKMTRNGIRYSTLIRTQNVSKAKRVLGYKPKVGMQEGLERSVKWFLENGGA
ncbi:hypothetical protein BJY04DRAFT_189346 [Aspergillus karnatakaensis]|uniref:uncharacterized protein n=1 Tax=Aspergillus karnatakaensis TaxID=1810916 RepID=UPI003CCD2320